ALVGSSGIIKVRNVNLSNSVSSDYPKSNYLLKFVITGELKVCNTPLPHFNSDPSLTKLLSIDVCPNLPNV
ncbi:hypothetical protein AB6C93_23845, partial [Vibrio splendidus]